MMRASAILGSPRRKGVTTTLATEFMQQLEKKGADTRVYHLNEMAFKGCQGCQGCKARSGLCVLEDDLTPALKSLREADILVFATPVYFWDVSGQFKLFVDRTWSLVKMDYETNPHPTYIERGKSALLITSQGAVEEKHREVAEKYAGFFTLYGYEVRTLRACNMGAKGGNRVQAYLEQIRGIAAEMTDTN
jgi:multimeric flavodoxin WrbA